MSKRYCSSCKRLEPKDMWDKFRIDHGETWLKIIIFSSIAICIGTGLYGIFNHHIELIKYQRLNEDTGEYNYKYTEEHRLNWGDGNIFIAVLLICGLFIPFGIFIAGMIKGLWL